MLEAIIKTLAYFSLFHYPLTKSELWQWLYCDSSKFSVGEFDCGLEELIQNGKVRSRNGFYFLPNHDNDIEIRAERYRLADYKWKKAKKLLWLVSWIPTIKAIFVCNSLAYDNDRADGDIDLFVVTDKNRIWLSRFLSAGLMSLLRLRPTSDKTKDKICLSFFVSADNLDMSKLLIDDDIYFTYWLATLKSIYDPQNYLAKIYTANGWFSQKIINNESLTMRQQRIIRHTWWHNLLDKLSGVFSFDHLESWSKNWQLKRFPPGIIELIAAPTTEVVVDDSILKFHTNDRRQEYRDEWRGIINGMNF